MKKIKFALVAFALLSMISFSGCQSSNDDAEKAINELNNSLDQAVDELETDIESLEEEITEEVDTTIAVEEATE